MINIAYFATTFIHKTSQTLLNKTYNFSVFNLKISFALKIITAKNINP